MPEIPVSPYATGGGGVTFERRVAAGYLALLLTGEGAAELGDARQVVNVKFQQAPQLPVDDLVVVAARPDEAKASLELAIAVRRAPKLVASNKDTEKLVTDFVRAVTTAPLDDLEHRLALVVAGPQTHAGELSELAALAAKHMDASSFFSLLRTPRKFRQALVDRLGHIEKLVAKALKTIGPGAPDEPAVELRTWELLSRLIVLMPRLEDPDTSDWTAIRNRLVMVARGNDLTGAERLGDRLEALAGQFGPAAATVDVKLVRREAHSLLEHANWRHTEGWAAIDHLQAQAFAAVRDRIGLGESQETLHLDRDSAGREVIALAKDTRCVVVYGDSGIGKSALVLNAARAAAAIDSGDTQAVCLNLRQLPEHSLELVKNLGCSVEGLLAELSAPNRLLVIDGADAATETRHETFLI